MSDTCPFPGWQRHLGERTRPLKLSTRDHRTTRCVYRFAIKTCSSLPIKQKCPRCRMIVTPKANQCCVTTSTTTERSRMIRHAYMQRIEAFRVSLAHCSCIACIQLCPAMISSQGFDGFIHQNVWCLPNILPQFNPVLAWLFLLC